MKTKVQEHQKMNFKKASKKLLLVLLATFALNCCHKDNPPKTELEKLPPATQTGANTAGCLVNGVAFLPKGSLTTGNLTCDYIDGKDFSLSIDERIMQGTSDIIRDINVASLNQDLHNNVGIIFQLKEYGANSKFGEYVIYNNNLSEVHYQTTSIVTGELKITYHNFNQAILSGTFWFDAINSNGEIVKVRDGRFDMHY